MLHESFQRFVYSSNNPPDFVNARKIFIAKQKVTLMLRSHAIIEPVSSPGDFFDVFVKTEHEKREKWLSPLCILSMDFSAGPASVPGLAGPPISVANEDGSLWKTSLPKMCFNRLDSWTRVSKRLLTPPLISHRNEMIEIYMKMLITAFPLEFDYVGYHVTVLVISDRAYVFPSRKCYPTLKWLNTTIPEDIVSVTMMMVNLRRRTSGTRRGDCSWPCPRTNMNFHTYCRSKQRLYCQCCFSLCWSLCWSAFRVDIRKGK